MHRQRMIILQLGFGISMLLLVFRLFWIQAGSNGIPLFMNERIILSSVLQRQQGVVLDPGRGHFYDREGRRLTGYDYISLAVFPLSRNETNMPERQAIRRLAELLGISEQQWEEAYQRMNYPDFWRNPGDKQPIELNASQAAEIRRLAIPGVIVVPISERYGPQASAAQLIGFTGQNPKRVSELYQRYLEAGTMTLASTIGGSGLEKTFDPFLQSQYPIILSYYTDAVKRPVQGLRWRNYGSENPYYPMKVTTTLDLELQQKLEHLLDRSSVRRGAVVVLDAHSADVLAMGSRPDFHPHHVSMEQDNWANRALKAAIPGSIFKTVVAITALETKKVTKNEPFICTGTYGRSGPDCWKKEGHGQLTLEEAYAVSCNVAFAQLAERITASELELTAQRLGLLESIGWSQHQEGKSMDFRQFDAEEAGIIFAPGTLSDDRGVKAQTFIGQRDVKMTPLAAANLAVTILNNGLVKRPRVVADIRYANDLIYKSFKPSVRGQAFSQSTARTLKKWMELVVQQGTGQRLKTHRWSLAGKSGTAQVQSAIGWGENEWFIGYGPAEDPRYVAAVLVQKEKADAKHQAIEVFESLMELLIEHAPSS